MGAAAGFFGAVASHAEQVAQRQRDEAEAIRADQRQTFHQTLANPNATSEQRAWAVEQLNKLNTMSGVKKGNSPYDHLGGLLNEVGQHLQAAGHPEANSPG